MPMSWQEEARRGIEEALDAEVNESAKRGRETPVVVSRQPVLVKGWRKARRLWRQLRGRWKR